MKMKRLTTLEKNADSEIDNISMSVSTRIYNEQNVGITDFGRKKHGGE